MSEKEKQLASDILHIFEQLPEPEKHQLLGVAQGMDIASGLKTAQAKDTSEESQAR